MSGMGHVVLPARQRKLLSILHDQKTLITGVELARKMEVSDRTIRNDIQELNQALMDMQIQIMSKRGKGYILEVEDATLLQQLIYSEDIFLTQEDRVRYLTIRLICATDAVRLGELEDEMFLSRTTLEKDLRILGELCSQRRPYLRLVRKENLICFEDNEEKKRLVLNRLFSEEWDYHSESGIHFRDSLFDAKVFDYISVCVKDMLIVHGLRMSDVALVHFVFAVAIAHVRILAGRKLQVQKQVQDNDSVVQVAIDGLCDRLQGILGVVFDCVEREYLMFLLGQKQLLGVDQPALSYGELEYVALVHAFLQEIEQVYGLQLMEDEELILGLQQHMYSLVNRLRNIYEMKSTILEKLKEQCPLSMEVAMLMIPLLKERFGLVMDENELSYIAAYVDSAISRLQGKALEGEIVVAVVSHLNRGSTQLLITRLKLRFRESIRLAGPFAVHEKDRILAANADIVLSTVRLLDMPWKDKPVLVVSPFLEENELMELVREIDLLKRNAVHSALPKMRSTYFTKELFFTDLELESREQVLKFLIEKLEKSTYLSPSVYEREKITATSFSCGIAMPHGVPYDMACVADGYCGKTAIAVAMLSKPIPWGVNRVQLVLLPVVHARDFQYMNHFLGLVKRLGRRETLRRILERKSLEEFLQLLDE